MLLILRGIPGSGKSTWALQTVASGFGVRLNRDDIRRMMYGVDFGPPIDEDVVTNVQKSSAFRLLADDTDVIIDNVNINLRPIRPVIYRAQTLNIPVWFKYFDVDLEVAIERNAARERKVPESVIRDFHERYTKIDRQADYRAYGLTPAP